MKYIYDTTGNRISIKHIGTIEEFKQEFGNNIFISNVDLGEKAIIEDGTIRAMTRLDRINEKLEELQDGEYIKDNEIFTEEKPNNFHFWDTNLNKWVYDQELEINALNDEILSLENELLTKYDEYDKAVARKLKTLEKKLNADIEELTQKIEQKYIRLEELEG